MPKAGLPCDKGAIYSYAKIVIPYFTHNSIGWVTMLYNQSKVDT